MSIDTFVGTTACERRGGSLINALDSEFRGSNRSPHHEYCHVFLGKTRGPLDWKTSRRLFIYERQFSNITLKLSITMLHSASSHLFD